MSEIDPEICRMTTLDVHAEVGQPFEATATFQGQGVALFAEHMLEWFREQRGENFVTLDLIDKKDGQRYQITMQRLGGKSPAEELSELRRQIEEMRGVYEQPIDDLVTRLPNVRPEMRREVMTLSMAALHRRILIQADWLGSYARAIEGNLARIPGSGVEGSRDPRNIRAIVDTMRKLLGDIYEADRVATEELAAMGLPVDSRFAHRIEDAIDLPSTRKRRGEKK